MMSEVRQRLARELQSAIDQDRREFAERTAAKIDGGLGLAAVAAISARVGDIAKDAEAALWARRAARSVDAIVQVFTGGATDEEIDAHTRLFLAIERERASAA